MRFHTGDLLTVTTGILVSPDGLDGVYRILNHLTGDTLVTHQLLLAIDAMTPVLHEQHPWLATVTSRPDGRAQAAAWLGEVVVVHGEYHNVNPAPEVWGKHDLVGDLKALGWQGLVLPIVVEP